MADENIDLAWRAVAAFNDRDAAAFAEFLTPDAELVPLRAAVEGTVYEGPDAASEFFAETDETWSDVAVEVDEVRGAGDVVLGLGVLRARGRASGAEVELQLGWVLRFRAGLISSFRTYTNLAEARRAAGLRE